MPSKEYLVNEYNQYYNIDPNKWVDTNRDEFAFKCLSEYLNREPKSLLDVGCGSGHTINYFSQRWTKTKYTGVDLSAVAVVLATKNVPHARFVLGWIDELHLPKFEVVTLLGVTEHFEDLQQGLKAVLKTMDKDGVCYMEIPNCLSYSNNKAEGFRRLEIGSRQYEWHLKRSTWNEELKKAGFEIVKEIKGVNVYSEFCYILRKAIR